MANPPAISTHGLGVNIEGKRILSFVSFQAAEGMLVGVLGPNGSGKTTLLRAIGGVQRYKGSIQLAGKEVSRYTARDLARLLAYVRQSSATTFDFSTLELVLLGRSAHKSWLGGYDQEDERVARAVLAAVGLKGFEERSVLSLSGGELQRAYLAQALAQESRFLLLDEPTSHLDIHYQFDLLHRVRSIVDAGRTAIVVLHDLELAARFADHLIVLNQGTIVADGPPARILTPDLIAKVFRMRATVDVGSGSVERVHFVEPVGAESQGAYLGASNE